MPPVTTPPAIARAGLGARQAGEPRAGVVDVAQHAGGGGDDDDQESYVRVFTTSDKARRDLARWKARRKDHNVFAGVVKRRVQ